MEILELINLDLDVWVKDLMSESCVVFLKKKTRYLFSCLGCNDWLQIIYMHVHIIVC